MDYLSLIRFTYPLFVLSTILMAALRSVETVSIALKISILSMIVDVSINYTLIFGKFGFPEMGTKGAAVGTLVARILELVIVVIYLIFADHKLKLFCKDFLHFTKEAFLRFFKILWPSFLSNTLWALATPIQTGILGRLSGRCDCSQFCFYDDVSVLESYNHRRSLSICCIDRNNDRGRQRNYKSKRIQ